MEGGTDTGIGGGGGGGGGSSSSKEEESAAVAENFVCGAVETG